MPKNCHSKRSLESAFFHHATNHKRPALNSSSWTPRATSAAPSSSSAPSSAPQAPSSISRAASRSAWDASPATSSIAAQTPPSTSQSRPPSPSASDSLSSSGSSPISAADFVFLRVLCELCVSLLYLFPSSQSSPFSLYIAQSFLHLSAHERQPRSTRATQQSSS